MNTIAYGGWEHCIRLSNGLIELIVTADVGPRVIRCGFVGGPNLFAEIAEDMGQTGGRAWRGFGGHRLWHAPEASPRTYQPDNTPITAIEQPGGLRLAQPTEGATGIQKEIDLALARDQAAVTVTHRLRNHNLWAVELAAWGITMMAPGGVGILPLPPRHPHDLDHLQPVSALALWSYTDPADPRWTWGSRFVLLRHDASAPEPQKAGLYTPEGWAAYALGGLLFVKQFDVRPGAAYPDRGCNAELFTNRLLLEVESLGPLTRLEPGQSLEHVERWTLLRDVPVPAGDEDVARDILPRLAPLGIGG